MVWVERFLIALAMVVTVLVLPPGVAFGQDSAQIVGTWRGTSVCTVPDSPCRNEENIYRFSEVPGKTRLFSCTGSKIIDGKEIVMGNSEWTFDPSKHELQTNSSTLTIRLTLNHNVLDGTLTLPDGKAYRRIHLSRSQ